MKKIIFIDTYNVEGNQVSISSTFYEQLSRAKTPKGQKDSQVVSLFMLLRSLRAKVGHKHVGEIDPRTDTHVRMALPPVTFNDTFSQPMG